MIDSEEKIRLAFVSLVVYKVESMSESLLCAEFRKFLENYGYTVYPEVSDWDLVAIPDLTKQQLPNLVRTLTPPELAGQPIQIGIQAKLTGNIEVLEQALRFPTCGPNVRAILVPRATESFIAVANHIGIPVFSRESCIGRTWSPEKKTYVKVWGQSPFGFNLWGFAKKFDITKPLQLPLISVDLPAGTACPKQLTPWREKALLLCNHGRKQGYLTSQDFKTFGVNMQRWEKAGWMKSTGKAEVGGAKRAVMKFVLTSTAPDVGWEEIAARLQKAVDEKKAI
jgi:hypothetical protein